MKTTELKIGDLVLYKGKLAKIIDFIGDILRCKAGGLRYTENYSASNVEPIPLTNEILEKNGWKKYKTTCQYRAKGLPTLDDLQSGFYLHFSSKFVLMKYIHQLQHILWALGIDDNLKV